MPYPVIVYAMKAFLQRPIWRAIILCIPLWIIFSNFLLAAISSIAISYLIGMITELRRLQARQRNKSEPPSSS